MTTPATAGTVVPATVTQALAGITSLPAFLDAMLEDLSSGAITIDESQAFRASVRKWCPEGSRTGPLGELALRGLSDHVLKVWARERARTAPAASEVASMPRSVSLAAEGFASPDAVLAFSMALASDLGSGAISLQLATLMGGQIKVAERASANDVAAGLGPMVAFRIAANGIVDLWRASCR